MSTATPLEPRDRGAERRAELAVLASFGVTALSGLALLVLYALGGQTQLEGLLLTLCLGGLGVGIVLWAQHLMAVEVTVEERHSLRSSPEDLAEAERALVEEAGFTRRRGLQLALLGALGGLASALAIPVLSLGPPPGRTLFVTSWRSGARLVGPDGQPVRAEDLPIDGVVTVYPEGLVGDADSQAVLIRTAPDQLRLSPEGAANAPDGYVCYSKICTHAGCPVGLYRASQKQLICPCHQSTFDVLTGANPTFGPAARPLPQLPIRLVDGVFVAQGDFPDPVGPSFWNMELGPFILGDEVVTE